MFDIVDFQLFEKYGIWHYNKNKNGLVRDHKYSRGSGYKNSVFPEILRHPSNCHLISHSRNVQLARSGNDDLISLEQLLT